MNIKIGKGGSGKINSTKGGSGKTNQKKYIDLLPNPSNLTFLFDPIFYKNEIQNERYKILVQNSTLDIINGIYSQTVDPSLVNNRAYFVKDDDSNMVIYYDGTNWLIEDLLERDYANPIFYKVDGCNTSPCRPDYLDWSTVDGGNAVGWENPPTITQHLNLMVQGGADLDPAFLETLRTYQQANIIPNLTSALTRQYIKGSSFNSRKVVLANNALKYIKNNDNSDVPYLKKYGRIITNTAADMNDNKKSLLICKKNDNSVIFNGNGTYTFNMFIKLQRPVSHKSPTNYIVREKRGIFFTSYPLGTNPDRALILGYRSPYYNINGDTTYKLKFEPFSFVFSFGVGMIGGMNFTLMTDYKYKFGEMYMLTIKKDANFISIYINGEQQTTASLAFNPCILPTLNNSRGPSRRRHQARMNIAPLAPGFLKKDGTAYSLLDTDWQVYNTGARNHHYLCFGKPLTNSPIFRNNGIGHSLRFKRHLNNLDIGVMNAYNIALSQSQISEMYNNFRYRYL